jgi:hypothetical protein
MADIVTGTVSGIVDTSGLVRDLADIRRETALEAGDVRRDVVKEAYHVADVVNSASNVGQRDASNYYIAEAAAATQTAKEIARSQAWVEAKVDANFAATTGQINLSTAIATGVTQLEAAKTLGALSLQHAIMQAQIAQEASATRHLIQANRIDELRDTSGERYSKIVELEGDRRDCERNYHNLDRSFQQNQWATMQNQLQMMNSDLQATKQSVVNVGAGTATGGAQTPTVIH